MTRSWLTDASGQVPTAESWSNLTKSFFLYTDAFRVPHSFVNWPGNIVLLIVALLFALGIASIFTKKSKQDRANVIIILAFTCICFLLSSGFWLNFAAIKNITFLANIKIHGYRFMLFARAGMLMLAAYGMQVLLKKPEKIS